MKKLSNSVNNWSLRLENRRQGPFTLFLLAFLDASFLPLPITTLFLVLALLNTAKAYRYALIVTLGTLGGALAGYAIGLLLWINGKGEFTGLAHFLFNNIPGFSVDFYNKIDFMYSKWGLWILSISTYTPIPYAIFSISSGVFKINIIAFCCTTLINQGIKFFTLALLTMKLGPYVNKLYSLNWKPLVIISVAGVIIVIVIKNSL